MEWTLVIKRQVQFSNTHVDISNTHSFLVHILLKLHLRILNVNINGTEANARKLNRRNSGVFSLSTKQLTCCLLLSINAQFSSTCEYGSHRYDTEQLHLNNRHWCVAANLKQQRRSCNSRKRYETNMGYTSYFNLKIKIYSCNLKQ